MLENTSSYSLSDEMGTVNPQNELSNELVVKHHDELELYSALLDRPCIFSVPVSVLRSMWLQREQLMSWHDVIMDRAEQGGGISQNSSPECNFYGTEKLS